MAAVAGLRGTGQFLAAERPEDFREGILWRRPQGETPFLALLSKATGGRSSGRIGKAPTKDRRFHWFTESHDIVRLQVTGTVTAAATATVVVDSSDPSTSNPTYAYGQATHCKPGDILLVEYAAASEATVFAPQYLRVDSVANATTLVVTMGACGSTSATLGDNAYLTLIGSSYGEGDNTTDARSRQPVEYSNYVQDIQDIYKITDIAEKTDFYTGDPLMNERERKKWDHASRLEFALMLGRKHEDTDSAGQARTYMDGFRRQIAAANVKIFSASATVATFFDAIYPVFDFATGAGDERIVLAGNAALNALNQLVVSNTNSEIELGPIVEQYGMRLQTVQLPQGRLYLRTHPLMNRIGMLNKSMFIVDFSAIRWRYMDGLDTHFLDDIQEKASTFRMGRWRTVGGLEVWHGGVTQGYIGNFYA